MVSRLTSATWQRFSMREAIIEFWPQNCGRKTGHGRANFSEAAEPLPAHARRRPGLRRRAESRTVEHFKRSGEQPHGKTIASIFEAVAEAHLIQPTIIYDFPLAVSPLSKHKPEEPDWVERFEFYIGGFEIGNAFSELNDPEEQRDASSTNHRARARRRRSAPDGRRLRRALGLRTAANGRRRHRHRPADDDPDRVAKSIRDVILFPLLRPQKNRPETDEPKPE